MGYAYRGDRSIYKLTIPEMARLQRGFALLEERRAEAADSAGQRTNHTQPTDGDMKVLEDFKRQLN